jgi:hypothetical protein
VPVEPVIIIPAGHASDAADTNALAAAESAHNSQQAACAHAETALKAADDALDCLSETQTVLGEIKVVVKQFGKCNMCKKWYFVHKDLCIYPGCSRNPLTSQVDTMGQELKALHAQVTAQEALINTMLHSSGTSSSSTASPAVLQAQAQQISALTGIIAQMVQHSAVQPVQHLHVPMPNHTSNGHTTAVMPTRCKPMPVRPPSSLAASPVPPAVAVHHAPVCTAPPALAGAAGLPAEHVHGDDDDDDDEDEDDGDEYDADTGASVEGACEAKPTKRKKQPVVKKGVARRRKHSADTM